MNSVKKELQALDDLAAPDVWEDAATRMPTRNADPPHRRYERVGVIVAALVLAGAGLALAVRAFTGGDRTVREPTGGERLYEANAFVMDSPETGQILCLGSVDDSGIPGCLEEGVVPVRGWSWEGVEPEGMMSGARWGYYHVVGTFDGSEFTLTAPPGAPRFGPYVEPESACPEPDGGWVVPRPDASDQSDLERTSLAVDDEPDFAGLWADRSGPDVVLNVAFTGNLAEHEAQIRRTWGGALCVVRFERSLRDLSAISRELEAVTAKLGLQFLTSGSDMAHNRIELRVLVATGADQRAMDERFGEGAVELTSALTRV